MTAQIISLPGGRSKFDIKEVRLTNSEIAHCVGTAEAAGQKAHLSPAQTREKVEAETTKKSEANFQAQNGNIYKDASARLADFKEIKQDEEEVRELHDKERKRLAINRYTKTPSKYDPDFRMNGKERAQSALYALLGFLVRIIAVVAIALYARGSGFSPDISTNWGLAIIFAFVALLPSGVLAARLDYTDSLDEKRHIAKRLGSISFVIFLVWAAATAILFAPQENSSTAFAVSLTSPAQTVQSMQNLIDLLFPKSAISTALLFTHILAEVFAAAALAAHGKLQNLKGRQAKPVESNEAKLHRELYDLHRGRMAASDEEVRFLEGVLEKYQGERSACVLDAVNRANSLMLEVEARTLQAKVEVIYGTAGIEPVARGA